MPSFNKSDLFDNVVPLKNTTPINLINVVLSEKLDLLAARTLILMNVIF